MFLDQIQEGSVKFPLSNFYQQKEAKAKSKPTEIHCCFCSLFRIDYIWNLIISLQLPVQSRQTERDLQGTNSFNLHETPTWGCDRLSLTPSTQGCYTKITPDPVFWDMQVRLKSYTQQSSLSFQVLASSNTWRWKNIFGVCWPKGLQQWHNQPAKEGYFMICALFSLLSTDYGNLITGFRVPIQPHNSSLFHSSDPEMSLFRDSCGTWKGYSSGRSAPLACCCVPHHCRAAGEVTPKWMLVTCYKKISALEDKYWCRSWRIPGQASQQRLPIHSIRKMGKKGKVTARDMVIAKLSKSLCNF